MDHLRIKENECNYQEGDRQYTEQFMDGIRGKAVTSEIIRAHNN